LDAFGVQDWNVKSYPHRFTITDPTEYPAPKEQISPISPSVRSSEYFENAMIDPAEDVLTIAEVIKF